MNRTALSLLVAAALACSAIGQEIMPPRAIIGSETFWAACPMQIVHSSGFVYMYQPPCGNSSMQNMSVWVTTEQEILAAALGGGTAEAQDLPRTVQLQPAYPNPFNPATTIEFSLDHAEQVRLVIHNLQGQEVAVIMDELLGAGRHSAGFDGAGLASGVYTYTLQAGGFSQTRTFTLVK